MDLHRRRLLTIVTEASLERELLRELESLGASGYTITDARGRGGRGKRASGWAYGANIRVEVVCEAELAARIAGRLRDRWYDDYAMILFVQDVEVLRPEKF
jgi:hypothetical protein